MVMHAPLFQHPGHCCGVVVRFQQHHIAGAGVVSRRDIPQQQSGGRLVHLLQGEHIRLLLCDEIYKSVPLCLIVRLDEAVGIQSQQFHDLYKISLMSDFRTSALGPYTA